MYPVWQQMQGGYMQPQVHMVPMQPQQFAWHPGMQGQMVGGVPPRPDMMPMPPGEENPPLPPEPPPGDDNDDKSQDADLKPKDPVEEMRLQQLKNQAAQWQQTLQMQQQFAPPGAQPMIGFPPSPLDGIKKEEEEFNAQYEQWKKQYDEWREQNKSHPNKDQFQQYLQQWQTYEQQMEEKRADIQRRKKEVQKQMKEKDKAAAKGQSFSVPPPGMMGQSFTGAPMPCRPGMPPGPRGPNFSGPPPPGPRPFGNQPPLRNQHPNFRGPGPRHMGPHSQDSQGFDNSESQGKDAGNTDNKESTISDDDHKDNAQLLEELEKSDNVQVNKIVLGQISSSARSLICQLENEGRMFLTAFPTMNPVQLNRMVRLVNRLGEESKNMKNTLTPQVQNRMKSDIVEELRMLRVDIPPQKFSGSTRGRGWGDRGGPGRGRGSFRGGNFGRGRGGNHQSEGANDGSNNGNFGHNTDTVGSDNRKGPVSLLDLNIDKPVSDKEGESQSGDKSKPEAMDQGMDGNFREDGNTFGRGGLMGQGGFNPRPPRPGGPRMMDPYHRGMGPRGPRGMMGGRGPPPGMHRPPSHMMGPHRMMRPPMYGMRPMGAPPPGMMGMPPPVSEMQTEVFQGEVFEPPPEEEKPTTSTAASSSDLTQSTTSTSQSADSSTTSSVNSGSGNQTCNIKTEPMAEVKKEPAVKLEPSPSNAAEQSVKQESNTESGSKVSQKFSETDSQKQEPKIPSLFDIPQINRPIQTQKDDQHERDRNQRPNWSKDKRDRVQNKGRGMNEDMGFRGGERNSDRGRGHRFGQNRGEERRPMSGNPEGWREEQFGQFDQVERGQFQEDQFEEPGQFQEAGQFQESDQFQERGGRFGEGHFPQNQKQQNNKAKFQQMETTDYQQGGQDSFQQARKPGYQQQRNKPGFQNPPERGPGYQHQAEEDQFPEQETSSQHDLPPPQDRRQEERFSREPYTEPDGEWDTYRQTDTEPERYPPPVEDHYQGDRYPPQAPPAHEGRYPPPPAHEGRYPPQAPPAHEGRYPPQAPPAHEGRYPPPAPPAHEGRYPPPGPKTHEGRYPSPAPPAHEGRYPPPGPPVHEGRYPPPEDRYPPPRYPPHDRFREPYGGEPFVDRRDPYWDRRDPYARPPDPYRDSYRRPLYDEPPYRPGYPDRYDPYRGNAPPPEREGGFRPAETIDYGHKPSAETSEAERPFQAPAVIDYGHGQSLNEPKTTSSYPLVSHLEEKDSNRPQPPPMDRDRAFPSPFFDRNQYGRPTPPPPPPGPPPGMAAAENKPEIIKVEDILCLPGRASRPQQIVVIVRGLPGSGKTYVSKLIKDKEVSKGGSAPRMLCLDDYFMIEVDRIEKDPETGKRMKKKVLEYEYEAEMESAYRQNMLKSFKKTIDDGFFPFIIVDAVFDRVKHFEEFWSYAKSKGFQVYTVELQCDVAVCAKRNTHKRTQREIEKIQHKWEDTPKHYIKLDIRSLLQEDSITDVEMEETDTSEPLPAKTVKVEEEDEEADHNKKSRWELDLSEGNLDKLDGLQHGKRKHSSSEQSSMEEFLQLADEYFAKQIQEPGKKRVRWADLEERKEQSYRRELGFVVGQTHEDWQRITDPHYADRQLNRTKYI